MRPQPLIPLLKKYCWLFLGFSLILISIQITNGCRNKTGAKQAKVSIEKTLPNILDKVRKFGVLRVGTTGDFKPFSYQTPQDSINFYGIDIELAKDLGKALGAHVVFVKTSWPNLMEDLKSGAYDIGMSGITITPERSALAEFSIPALTSGKAAITRDENVSRFTSLEEINKKGVKVIVNPGGTNEAFSRANFPNATLVENDENMTIFQKIVDGEADLMVTDATETLVQERIHPELDAVNPETPFNSFQMGFIFKKDVAFKTFVDQWLTGVKTNGNYAIIFEKELGKIK
jgi:cyclohexadienyl dehydratase